MNKLLPMVGALCVVAQVSALASSPIADKIVVKEQRFPTAVSKTGQVINVITQADIESLGLTSIDQVLNQVSPVSVVNAGGNRSLFLRGGASNGYKIYVDGVQLIDPSTPQDTPYLDTLTLGSISRIEIISGSQGALFGSGAAAGVINIVTDRSRMGNFTKTSVSASDRMYTVGLVHGFQYNGVQINANAEMEIDQSRSALSGTDEIDSQSVQQFGLTVNRQFQSANVTATITKQRGQFDLDGFGTDDPNYTLNSEQDLAGISVKIPVNSWLNASTQYSFNQVSRFSNNEADAVDPSEFSYETKGKTETLEILGAAKFSSVSALAGIERISTVSGSDRIFQQNKSSIFTHADIELGPMVFLAGVRQESGENYQVNTGSLGAKANLLYSTFISVNYRRGFRSPSLYETFDLFSGNADLIAERTQNREYSVGWVHPMISSSLTYFDNSIQDKIDYIYFPETFSGQYQNAQGNTQIKGTELSVAVRPGLNNVNIGAQYVRYDAQGPSGPAQRIPEYKWTITNSVEYGALTLTSSWVKVGPRVDGSRSLNEYDLFNNGVVYALDSQRQLSFSVFNSLNNRHLLANDYEGARRRVTIGFKQTI